jgi:hypothetical protein
MTAAAVILSILLIAEFVFAPVNLWTGRTTGTFGRFTGLRATIATRVLAPVKLASAAAVAVGLAVPALSIAGAAVIIVICGFYLLRLSAPGRRDPAGIIGFAIFGAWAVALLLLRTLG